jgi:hypothetical protein
MNTCYVSRTEGLCGSGNAVNVGLEKHNDVNVYWNQEVQVTLRR